MNGLTIYKPDDVDYLPDKGDWTFRIPIPSESSDRIYIVSKNKKTGLWGCSCMSYRTRRTCKHLTALQVPTPPKLLGRGARPASGPKRSFADNYERYDTSGGYGNIDTWLDSFEARMGIQEATRQVGSDSPHAILGVSPAATWNEIRNAYRKLAKALHPDVNPQPGAAENFRKLQAAFELLEDKKKRGQIL